MTTTFPAPPQPDRVLSVKETAAAIRKALRQQWPGVKFSVTMSPGTGYGWLNARWTDGPTAEAFHAFTDRFRDQRFDGMDDGYHRVNPGTRYRCNGVNGSRSYSPEATAWAEAQVAAHPGRYERDYDWHASAAVQRVLHATDLTGEQPVTATVLGF